MSRADNAFRPGVVAGVLFVGALAFLLLLFAIGKGWAGGDGNGSGGHAASRGLNGFAGMATLLEKSGYAVELSRNPARMEDYALVVLTPPHHADPAEIQSILDSRRNIGPTMLIMPKWLAMPIPDAEAEKTDAEADWVKLAGAETPPWFNELDLGREAELAVGKTSGWNWFGESGNLPQAAHVQALTQQPMFPLDPLVVDGEGDLLAGVFYPDDDEDLWPVVVVFEPDLINNFGMADVARARLALSLVDEATGYEGDVPIIFDLTFAGLGDSQNLLTLAFTPPFLAATLCLILAALVIAWRAFRRFGPPVAEAPSLVQGKTQLARNGAVLLGRLRRWNLLAEPYAALVTGRIAGLLGVRTADSPDRDAAIERALVRAGHDDSDFAKASQAMRNAQSPGDILRAARALKAIERMLKP